jgi:RNA polymerase sigma-70 factor, ECF subfamily
MNPAPAADETRSSLLLRVRDQDAEAWRQLVLWIGPFILRTCRKAGLQATDADDVSQSVLETVWSRLHTFRKDNPRDSFRGWVYTITRNRVIDFRRRPTPRPLPSVELPDTPDPAEAGELENRALSLILREAAVRHAADPGFKAFYRTAVDGLTAPQAAAELGLTAWAVRQHKSRWIARLRERLRDEYGPLLD